MAYSAEISRVNPSCFLFVIDQSGSMQDVVSGSTRSKAQGVADAINKLLQNLVIKCAKSEGVRDYYHVGVIGYGQGVAPAFGGALAGRDLAPIGEIANSPTRIEERAKKVDDGAGGLVEQKTKFPIWFDAVGNGSTPMCQAMGEAHRVLAAFLAQHPNCFPPVVVHITDGESTDGDPTQAMNQVTSLASADGNIMLFNIHLSSNPDAKPIEFPDSSAQLPDPHARLLLNTASVLTPFMRAVAKQDYRLELSEQARGFVLNADMVLVITTLDIGTRPSNLR
jgi:hypothetical protein